MQDNLSPLEIIDHVGRTPAEKNTYCETLNHGRGYSTETWSSLTSFYILPS